MRHSRIDVVVCVECITHMKFGPHVREIREAKSIGLRELAGRIGVEPAYLSKIEREIFPPPSEGLIVKIAGHLAEDPDQLLALAGKIPSDVKEAIILSNGKLAKLIREWVKENSVVSDQP
jgi:HTH-type transcriptional regulator, competence development regulator